MYHALALIGVGILLGRFSIDGCLAELVGLAVHRGRVLFCGSLYALSLRASQWLGAITPLGGLAFLLGWLALAASIWRS